MPRNVGPSGDAVPTRATPGAASSRPAATEAAASPKPVDTTTAADLVKATPAKPAVAPARAKSGSLFDAPIEPFELRPPNEVAPVSVASAVASALHARPRPVPFVAPDTTGDKPAVPVDTPKSHGKAPDNAQEATAPALKPKEAGAVRETPGPQAPRPPSDS